MTHTACSASTHVKCWRCKGTGSVAKPMKFDEEYLTVMTVGLYWLGRRLIVNPRAKCKECQGIGLISVRTITRR